MTRATFQVIEADDGFRWRLRTDDGTVLATSDRTHGTEHAAMRDIQQLKHVAATAGVERVDRNR